MSKDNSAWVWIFGIGLLIVFSGGTVLMTYSPTIRRIAHAIAIAERGQREIASGAVPRNNPGDIEDSSGNLITYPTLEEGWNALYHQVGLMFSGSRHYTPDMTIAQIAEKYVGTPDWVNWAANVASQLGVTIDTPLSEV